MLHQSVEGGCFVFMFYHKLNSGCDTVTKSSSILLCAFILLTGDLGSTFSHRSFFFFSFFSFFTHKHKFSSRWLCETEKYNTLPVVSPLRSETLCTVYKKLYSWTRVCVWHHCSVIGCCSISVLLRVSTVIGVSDWQHQARDGLSSLSHFYTDAAHAPHTHTYTYIKTHTCCTDIQYTHHRFL